MYKDNFTLGCSTTSPAWIRSANQRE